MRSKSTTEFSQKCKKKNQVFCVREEWLHYSLPRQYRMKNRFAAPPIKGSTKPSWWKNIYWNLIVTVIEQWMTRVFLTKLYSFSYLYCSTMGTPTVICKSCGMVKDYTVPELFVIFFFGHQSFVTRKELTEKFLLFFTLLKRKANIITKWKKSSAILLTTKFMFLIVKTAETYGMPRQMTLYLVRTWNFTWKQTLA